MRRKKKRKEKEKKEGKKNGRLMFLLSVGDNKEIFKT